MISRVMFGDLLDFEQKNGFTRLFVNGIFVYEIPSCTDIETDIGILMNVGYDE